MPAPTDAARRSGAALQLVHGSTRAVLLPHEGGVISALEVAGADVLARTPWHDEVDASAEPAGDEAQWVARWRGGWQLCFPTSGAPDPDAAPRQGFHGAASQSPWRVIDTTADAATLVWEDAAGLRAERRWRVLPDGLAVTTRATNGGAAARFLAIAEHLILGQDVLRPVSAGAALAVDVPDDTRIAPLAYSGAPDGPAVAWPGVAAEAWDAVDARTPARVAALLDPVPGVVRLIGPALTATVRWWDLPHALLWEELAQSAEPPWLGAVTALGIEPTSTPHGLGTASGRELIELAPGEEMSWSVELRVAPSADTPPADPALGSAREGAAS